MSKMLFPKRCFFLLAFFIAFSFTCVYAQKSASKVSWQANWSNPKVFIENKGQYNNASLNTLFALDDGAAMYYFSKKGIDYKFVQRKIVDKAENMEKGERDEQHEKTSFKTDQVSLSWEGANPNVQIITADPSSDYNSYSVKSGNAETNINFIKGYRKIIYKDLYPSIDVEYTFHPSGQGIKYALILHPGADISMVKMKYTNAVALGIDGNVHISGLFGGMIDHAPNTFYAANPSHNITSAFVKLNNNTVSFTLGQYDKTQEVIVDPWTTTISLANSNKIWETETDGSGNVYIYGGDSPMRIRKYNAAGALQWTYTSPWDTANYWIGTFITDQAGNSYITSGSNGEIKKLTTAGTVSWSNNPNGLFGPLFEYWHLAFNCDNTKLAVGGMRAPSPFDLASYSGAIMDINLSSGAILSYKNVAANPGSFLPKIQEVSSMCSAPNGNYYFLTLDTVGSVKSDLSVINFKIPTLYNLNYYIPAYGATKLGISAIKANANFFYTHNGITVQKRDLLTGVVLASAPIPGGINSTSLGENLPGNSGLDIDNCGNVYVGSGNQVVKYDANLNQLSTAPTAFAVYDVSVNNNGEVIACGYGGGQGYLQSISMSACAQMAPTCTVLPLSLVSFNVSCSGSYRIFNWTTATELNNDHFTVEHSKDGITYNAMGTTRGAGNSNRILNYHAVFPESDGYKYYRLKQTDYNALSSYSAILSSDCNKSNNAISLYPVPAGNIVSVRSDNFINAEITYQLYDAKGRVLKEREYFVPGSDHFSIDITSLPSAAYFIKVSTKNAEVDYPVLKFVKE